MTLHLLPGMNFSQWAVTPFLSGGGGDDRYSAGGFGRALGDAARAILRGVAQQRAREARLRAGNSRRLHEYSP